MKKIAFIMAALLMISLSGCAQKNQTQNQGKEVHRCRPQLARQKLTFHVGDEGQELTSRHQGPLREHRRLRHRVDRFPRVVVHRPHHRQHLHRGPRPQRQDPQRVRHQRRKHRRWLIQRPQESLPAVQMGREAADELKIEN